MQIIWSFSSVRFLTIASLVFVLVLSVVVVPQGVGAQVSEHQFYERSFAWDYEGQHWTWDLSIPVVLYDAYRDVPVSVRTRNGPGGYGYMTTTQDYYVGLLAQKLDDVAIQMGYDNYDKASFVLAFVQHLPYTSDLVTTGYDEYPRFPIETLVDEGGDCEDVAVLFATLMRLMGYGVVYINPPNHYAVGILGENLRGTYWTYPQESNQTYYYCETTGVNFKIGQLPPEFSGQSVKIYAVDESVQFVPDIARAPPAPQPSPTQATSSFDLDPSEGSSEISGPVAQPVLPLSVALIVDNLGLFGVIIGVIAISMVITVLSTRRRSKRSPQASTFLGVESQPSGDSRMERFCVFCGVANNNSAVFCEKCGKQIN